MLKKRLLSIFLLIAATLTLCMPALAALDTKFNVDGATFDEDSFVIMGEKLIRDYLAVRESEFYDVKDITFTNGKISYTDDELSFDTMATVKHILKAKDVEDLPYVSGALSTLGVSTFKALSEVQKINAIENMITQTTYSTPNVYTHKSDYAENAINFLDGMMAEYDSYIGEITEINFYFNVSIRTEEWHNINEQTVIISALDSCNNRMDISEYDTRSAEEMYAAGAIDMEENLYKLTASELVTMHAGATPIDNWSKYDRIKARDYAYKWWGPTESNYNPDYTNWNSGGGDCANFVSQCIFAGGVPVDEGKDKSWSSDWYKDSHPWISTSELSKYMTNRGYATKEDYTDTTAGNFATKPGHSVLVTINNTVDICFTAHNTNRLDAPFSKTELNGTYTFYVIKNF